MHDSSIAVDALERNRKTSAVKLKVIFNYNKVGTDNQRGINKFLLEIFNDMCANKLKRPIKLHAGVSCYQLIDYLRKQHLKLHQLNISELILEMTTYFDVNE